ncbi:MAG: hypothetical protein D6820_13275 [Lentisphaerae bacterium]|nr:MAG: hypothetical protein D6820_13275 [Lentisphaerota bacterium]
MNTESPFVLYSEWLAKKYGERIYRVPVNPGFPCPRDRTEGKGCIFCPRHGHAAVQNRDRSGLQEQVGKAIEFARRRYRANGFLLYLQAYTPTNTQVETFRALVETLLPLGRFHAIHIGTRPDCLPEPMVEYLAELTRHLEVCVELGVQSIHDQTL